MENEKVKILLFESFEGALSPVEKALKDSNYRSSPVEKAGTADSFREKIGAADFDVVFSKWEDGFKVAGELKKSAKNIPLIVVTEIENRKEGTELMRHGAFSYLLAPVDSVEVEALISRAGEKKQLVDETEKAKQTTSLYNVSQALGSIMKLGDALKTIMKIACESVGADGGTIMLFDRKTQELEVKVAAGEESEKVLGLRFKSGQRVSGRAILEGRPVLIKDYQKLEGDARFRGMKKFGNTLSSMAVPILMQGQTIGVISLKITRGERRFSDGDVKVISIFAGNAAFAIENARVYEEIASAKTYIENIIKSMIDSVIIANPDGTIKSVNTATENLLEYSEKQLAGLSADVIFQNAEDNPFRGEKLAELKSAGAVKNRELVYLTKNGADVPVMFSGSVLRDNTGAVIGIVGVAKDMRDVKKLQDDLLQSRKLASIGELGAGIAHELNSPLAGLLTLIDVLIRRTPQDDRNYPLLTETKTAIKFCKDIVSGLLAFSRAPKGKFAPVNCNEAIDGILSFMSHQLEVKNVNIRRNFDDGLKQINGDMSQIQQVFLNMITNARDAMPEGGEITITTRNNGKGSVNVLFSDKGYGIPKENIQKIFDPFFSTKSRGEGTGLGLATSIGIVKAHNGSIEVESEVGTGTTFTIVLPSIE